MVGAIVRLRRGQLLKEARPCIRREIVARFLEQEKTVERTRRRMGSSRGERQLNGTSSLSNEEVDKRRGQHKEGVGIC